MKKLFKMINFCMVAAIALACVPVHAMESVQSTADIGAAKEVARYAKGKEKAQKQTECLLCFDEKDDQDMIELSCEHTYCALCLDEMVQLAIGEKTCAQLTCPNPKCGESLSTNDISKINSIVLKSNKLEKKQTLFDKWFAMKKLEAVADISAKEWLSKYPFAKQCPTVNCSYVFLNECDEKKNVTCPSCNHLYCAMCLFEHKQGSDSCEEARASAKKEDAENQEWKKKNTKTCPKCKKSIEKNGGCEHVQCTQCKYEFCWNCLGPHNHGPWHECFQNNNLQNPNNGGRFVNNHGWDLPVFFAKLGVGIAAVLMLRCYINSLNSSDDTLDCLRDKEILHQTSSIFYDSCVAAWNNYRPDTALGCSKLLECFPTTFGPSVMPYNEETAVNGCPFSPHPENCEYILKESDRLGCIDLLRKCFPYRG